MRCISWWNERTWGWSRRFDSARQFVDARFSADRKYRLGGRRSELGQCEWAEWRVIAGYLGYDYMHYHLHHHTPTTKLGKQLREQHMRHHFQDHRYGFGVSSPLWDLIFHTLPRRRRA